MKIPILQLKNLLLTSIQVELTDRDAIDFQYDVVHKVAETGAEGLVIDITAMDVVDSFIARALNETARMARLVGAEVVICGMQPTVALTLVEMGRELIDVESALNLDHGFEKAQRLISAKKRMPG